MKDISALKKRLEEIEKVSNEDWMGSLSDRKRNELEFHDADRDVNRMNSLNEDEYEKFYGNKKYYQGTSLSRFYLHKWIRENAKDRIFLDYACGNGGNAIEAAKYGAKIAIGLDLSRVSIENAKSAARKEKVDGKTYFIQADAETTMLPDASIDTVVCSGMLHHLDLSYAFFELRRILRPGGKLLAFEALNYNPAIKLYRYLTPNMRTNWEKHHILGLKDIRFAKRFFEIGEIRYWHITSILAPHMLFALETLNWIDQFLTRIPILRLMAWTFTFELIKHKDV